MELVMENVSANCTGYTSKKNQEIIFIVKIVFACVGIIVNFVAIVLFLLFKSYILFIFRIVLYIMIANMLQVIMQVLELFPIVNYGEYNDIRKGWRSACRSFGFLDQVTVWMGHLSVLWLVLYFWHLIRKETRLPNTRKVDRREIVGVAVCFFLPFVFNWIPFVNDYYGFSGSWCWIKLTKEVCNDTNVKVGLAFILVLYYIPLLVFVLINTVSCLAIFVMTCWMRKRAKEVAFVVVYPFVYNLFFIVACISRIDSTVHIRQNVEQSFPLWVAHAVADPCRIIIPAILAIFMLPFIKKAIDNVNATVYESV